jgi:hypothetical protein
MGSTVTSAQHQPFVALPRWTVRQLGAITASCEESLHLWSRFLLRHCEERSDVAVHGGRANATDGQGKLPSETISGWGEVLSYNPPAIKTFCETSW